MTDAFETPTTSRAVSSSLSCRDLTRRSALPASRSQNGPLGAFEGELLRFEDATAAMAAAEAKVAALVAKGYARTDKLSTHRAETLAQVDARAEFTGESPARYTFGEQVAIVGVDCDVALLRVTGPRSARAKAEECGWEDGAIDRAEQWGDDLIAEGFTPDGGAIDWVTGRPRRRTTRSRPSATKSRCGSL